MAAVGDFFCCMNPVEKAAMRQMALAFVAGLGQPVPSAVWSAFWVTSLSKAARKEQFINLYGLEHGSSASGCAPSTSPCIRFINPLLWASIAVFVGLPSGLCPDPCGLPVWP